MPLKKLFAAQLRKMPWRAPRSLRQDLHTVYDPYNTARSQEVSTAGTRLSLPSLLGTTKLAYWSRASQVTAVYGAKPNFELDDYFTVSQDRSYDHIQTQIRNDFSPGSIPVVMVDSIESYKDRLSIDAAVAAQILMTVVKHGLGSVREESANKVRLAGLNEIEASRQAMTEFLVATTSAHIETIQNRRLAEGPEAEDGVNKRSFYPTFLDDDPSNPSLKLTTEDADGMSRVYHLQERPYSDDELSFASELMKTAAMQLSILQFHEGLIDHSRGYLDANPQRAKYSMEPFSEIFIPAESDDGLDLLPNPKLIKIIANNVMPAVARSMRTASIEPKDIQPEHIKEGVDISEKMGIFQTTIGEFNGHNPDESTVELQSMFKVACPASRVFIKALGTQLPQLFESALQVTADLPTAVIESL